MTIEEALALPTVLTVEQAAELLCIRRTLAYEAVKAGAIPSIRLGRLIRIPTATLLKMVGLDSTSGHPDIEAGTDGVVLMLGGAQ